MQRKKKKEKRKMQRNGSSRELRNEAKNWIFQWRNDLPEKEAWNGGRGKEAAIMENSNSKIRCKEMS